MNLYLNFLVAVAVVIATAFAIDSFLVYFDTKQYSAAVWTVVLYIVFAGVLSSFT